MALLLEILNYSSGAVILALSCAVLILQGLILVAMLWQTHRAHRERIMLYQELFGLMRKIEGLSSGKRAMILHQFDNLLESLVKQLPTRIAAEAGERIFETESQFLRALVDLEPSLRGDLSTHKRLEQLIQSMENLETTVTRLTCESVRQAMLDVRHTFLAQESMNNM